MFSVTILILIVLLYFDVYFDSHFTYPIEIIKSCKKTYTNLLYYGNISSVPIEQTRLEKGKSIFVYKIANTSNFQPYK